MKTNLQVLRFYSILVDKIRMLAQPQHENNTILYNLTCHPMVHLAILLLFTMGAFVELKHLHKGIASHKSLHLVSTQLTCSQS
jgi:hypothetical protein